jgi:transposase
MTKDTTIGAAVTIGVDMSDRYSQLCVLDDSGEILEEARIRTTPVAFQRRFGGTEAATVAIEAGTHSLWASRLLRECGHRVLVANPRKLRLIYQNDAKDDRVDAQYLARVARLDPELLAPVTHRETDKQADLAVLRARDGLVRSRTQLVNQVRGLVKTVGARLPSCSAASFHRKAASHIPEALRPAVGPTLLVLGELTKQIRRLDSQVEQLARERYPETELLRQVTGVGALTSLAYVLGIDDPHRFRRSRSVGAYLGLVPRRDESGDSRPQLRITKAGSSFLRRLLVGSAHYILGPFGPDCDLRRFGLRLAQRGGKNAKKRATVAVARKLSVLLHRLWVTGEVYDPLRQGRDPSGPDSEVAK